MMTAQFKPLRQFEPVHDVNRHGVNQLPIRIDVDLSTIYENLYVLPGAHSPSYAGKALGAFVNTRALQGARVLDLGCGAGHLGITAALNGAVVDASDISSDAVECAKTNAAQAGVKIDVRQGVGFDCWPEDRWDAIIVNGPGFEPVQKGNLDAAALDGLQRVKPIPRLTEEVFRQSRRRLTPKGQIIGLIGGSWAFAGIDDEAHSHGLEVEVKQRFLYRGPLREWGLGISHRSMVASGLARPRRGGVEIEFCVFVLRRSNLRRAH